MRRHLRCSIGGSASTNEIPPLGTLLHLSNEETTGCRHLRVTRHLGLGLQAFCAFNRDYRSSLSVVVGACLQVVPIMDSAMVATAPITSALRCGVRVLFRDICQMGSLAGAAYLLHDNAGVLRRAQWEQKSHVEHKRKGSFD